VGGHNEGPVRARGGVHTAGATATAEKTVGVAETTAALK